MRRTDNLENSPLMWFFRLRDARAGVGDYRIDECLRRLTRLGYAVDLITPKEKRVMGMAGDVWMLNLIVRLNRIARGQTTADDGLKIEECQQALELTGWQVKVVPRKRKKKRRKVAA